MSWVELTSDELDDAFGHFFGLSSAGLARVCELIREVDVRQSWMIDGASRFVHQHGWHLTGDPNDSVTFRKPDWTPYPRSKPGLHPRIQELVNTRPT